MKTIDWKNLGFGYSKADYNIRCWYRNGQWGELEVSDSENITLHILAKRSGVTPGYFSTLFKSYTGYSPIDYIHTVKIDMSKQLLLQNIRIKEVSDAIGFSNEYYFSDVFKKVTGIRPRDFLIQIHKIVSK